MELTGQPVTTGELSRLRDALAVMPAAGDDAERIDRIRLLEEVKAAACAAQAIEVAAFDASQQADQAAAGIPVERRARGIAAQVALAMRISHHAGQKFTSWARIAPVELPATFAELRAGQISEWAAMIVARETAPLSREHRAAADAELAPRLTGWSAGQVDAQTRKLAYRLDPHAASARAARAREQRRVTVRPIPDAMARLSAELPVEQAVACWAALRAHADGLIGTGHAQGRTRSQVMADTLTLRLIGRAPAVQPDAGDADGEGSKSANADRTGTETAAASSSDQPTVSVEIQLVMTDTSLLAPAGTVGRDEPALIPGYGWIPAALARQIALDTDATDCRAVGHAPRWLQRLFRHPDTGQLAAMDSRRRLFSVDQRRFLTARDQTCRSPYCDAPIRHLDHVTTWDDVGLTHTDNGQGYCAACNHAKQAPGWATTAAPDGTITTRTPTGHTYVSPLPDPPGPDRHQIAPSRNADPGDLGHHVSLGRYLDITELTA